MLRKASYTLSLRRSRQQPHPQPRSPPGHRATGAARRRPPAALPRPRGRRAGVRPVPRRARFNVPRWARSNASSMLPRASMPPVSKLPHPSPRARAPPAAAGRRPPPAARDRPRARRRCGAHAGSSRRRCRASRTPRSGCANSSAQATTGAVPPARGARALGWGWRVARLTSAARSTGQTSAAFDRRV